MMVAAGAAPTFLCPPKMHRLLSSLAGRQARRRKAPEGESFDAQIAVSSLPRAFATRLDSVPAPVPYLRAEPELRAKMGGAHRRGRRQDRHRLAGQSPIPKPTWPARCRSPPSRRSPRSPGASADLVAEGLRRRAARRPAAGHAGRDARRRFRRRTRRLRRHGGGDGASRSRRHLRHFGRPSRRRARPADLGRPEEGRGMALAARSRRFAVVSDDALFPSERSAAIWSGVFAAMAGRARLARSGSGGAGRPIDIPGAVGELIDKIAILKIKSRRIDGRRQVRATCAANSRCSNKACGRPRLDHRRSRRPEADLAAVNERLWDVEDEIRLCEKNGRFRRTVRRARALRLCDQRSARGDQARDQPPVQFGDRRGKVLRLIDGGGARSVGHRRSNGRAAPRSVARLDRHGPELG